MTRSTFTSTIDPLLLDVSDTSLHVTPEQFDRVGQEVEVLELPMSIDCSEVMPEFILNLAKIW